MLVPRRVDDGGEDVADMDFRPVLKLKADALGKGLKAGLAGGIGSGERRSDPGAKRNVGDQDAILLVEEIR